MGRESTGRVSTSRVSNIYDKFNTKLGHRTFSTILQCQCRYFIASVCTFI